MKEVEKKHDFFLCFLLFSYNLLCFVRVSRYIYVYLRMCILRRSYYEKLEENFLPIVCVFERAGAQNLTISSTGAATKLRARRYSRLRLATSAHKIVVNHKMQFDRRDYVSGFAFLPFNYLQEIVFGAYMNTNIGCTNEYLQQTIELDQLMRFRRTNQRPKRLAAGFFWI